MSRLALIAGTGALPTALVARLSQRPLICALRGFAPEVTPDITFRIEHLGTFLEMLRDRGVTEVCMAGAVRRPDVEADQVDAATAPLVPRVMAAIAAGDDGALRGVIAIFEEAGFTVKAAHELLPDLLPPAGVLGAVPVPPEAYADAAAGERCVAAMGVADLGQACLVRGGEVLARESDAGTAAMLARFATVEPEGGGGSGDPFSLVMDTASDVLGGVADWLSGPTPQAKGAVLFKAPKPDQDRRADLPVIGPDTAVAAHRARLAGIVIEADGVMVLDLPAVLHICDSFGMFLWVRPRGGA